MCCFTAAIPSRQCCHLKSAHIFHTVKTRPLSCIFIFAKLPKRDFIVQFCNGDFNKRTIHWKLISSMQDRKWFYRPSLNWDEIFLISCSESARLNSSRITFRSKSYNIVIFAATPSCSQCTTQVKQTSHNKIGRPTLNSRVHCNSLTFSSKS